MRRVIASVVMVCVLLLSVSVGHAQVYNTAQKLKSGTFRLCVAPLLLTQDHDVDFGMYILGGVGITSFMDLYATARAANDNRSNFGLNIQWALVKGSPALSLSTGGHIGPWIGIDGTLDIAIPAGNAVVVYGGLDADVDFDHGETTVPAWIFIGPRIQIRRNTTLFLEVDVGVTEAAPSILGLGLSFYL